MIEDPVAIPVRRGGRIVDYAWVDASDAERVRAYRWGLSAIHAVASIPSIGPISMHRFILGLKRGDKVVHHRNEDGLDNRRRNLKIVADKGAHGSEPHPRKNAMCGRHAVPPHERELALMALKTTKPAASLPKATAGFTNVGG
jgi:hypothetical protein